MYKILVLLLCLTPVSTFAKSSDDIYIECIYNRLHFEPRDITIIQSKKTNAYAIKYPKGKPVIRITKPMMNRTSTNEALLFIIAHEEGNIRLNHLGKFPQVRSIKRELEADRYAIFIMFDRDFDYKTLQKFLVDLIPDIEKQRLKQILHTLDYYKNRFEDNNANNSNYRCNTKPS